MKKYLHILILITALTLITTACNDPVFYTIYLEVEPREPIIKGRPTNIIEYNGMLYTASGKNVYTYTNSWQKAALQPDGTITHLAASGSYLYALCGTRINRLSTERWEQLDREDRNDNFEFRSMYGAGGVIFIGAENRNIFRIFYIDENEADMEKAVKPLNYRGSNEIINGELCGAAGGGGWHYLITKEKGAYKTDDPQLGAEIIPGSDGVSFTGIVNLENNSGTIISISRKGSLYILGASAEDTNISFSSDNLSTGALAIWSSPDNPDVPTLLLAGRQNTLQNTSSTSYNYGYLEIELDSEGIKPGARFREPGTQPSSIDNNERFKSTIGRQPVNHIFQTPYKIDSRMILFASTQKNGLWSYRVRDGIPQWNAED